jgi:Protein of unknown function (DUF3253)
VEPPSVTDPEDSSSTRRQLRDAILTLLRTRASTSTICPSEAPRRVRPGDWRSLMEATREEARQLADEGALELTQGGVAIDHRKPWKGPIRLRLCARR